MSDVVRAAIATAMRGGTLTIDEARGAMDAVMDGEATPAQLGGLLLALRMRTETVDELAGFAQAMRERVLPVDAPADAIDTCGTGGDGSHTFNISTAAAFVVAAAGVPVAKHGNRAMSSATGSADVLEALGVPVDLGPDSAGQALATRRFAFLFAPTYHPAMRHAGPVRRELGTPTAFNWLGPVTNPARVRRQVIGVGDPLAAPKVAQVLFRLGSERALVVHGAGVDELPLDGSGVAYDVSPLGVRRRRIDSRALGFAHAPTSELRGGDAAANARIIERVLDGARGPQRDVVLLNAGAALLVAGRARRLADGIALAEATIDSGRARALLDDLRGSRVPATAAASAA
jgi:anthranilate phosphoribosyltransferase